MMKHFCESDDIDQRYKMEDNYKSLYDGHRVTGVFECAHVLESYPEDVLCCILPSNSDRVDVSIRIQHTLIEAYCLENDIQVIKVDSNEEVRSLLQDTSFDRVDLDCILVCDKEVSTDSVIDDTDIEIESELFEWPS